MVKSTTIIAVCITLFITLLLPLIIYVVYGIRNKGKGVWTAWLLGAAGFFIFQVIIRMPILSILSQSEGFLAFSTEHYVLYCLVLAFTAALFEVAGRYIVAKIMNKNLTVERSIAAGLGHGSIESMVLIGMTYINNLVYITMINAGTFDGVVEQATALGADTSSLLTVKETLINSGAGIFLLAGYERILTMILHVALTMIVCYFVSCKRDIVGIGICVLWHWLVDFVTPLINGLATEYMGNILSTRMAYAIVYVFLTIVAGVAILVVCKIKMCWQRDYRLWRGNTEA